MRVFLSTILVIFTILFLTGCDETEPSKSDNVTKPKSDVKIALVMKTLTNPFFITMEQGARKAAKELGITLVVKAAAQETSTTQQISIVDRLVREKQVQAIVIAPANSIKLIPSLKKAQDQGIYVINLDNPLDPAFSKKANLKDVPFISVDNKRSAYLSAKYVADSITAPTEVGILEGIREATNANDRKEGALMAFGENKNTTVVASETAHWKIDEGYEVTRKMFASHPNITLLFCANDMMALGAIEYLKETNRKSVKVAAFDAIDDARVAIKEGWMDVTIDQQPAEQGYQGVIIAMKAIKKQNLPETIMLDGLVISK
ncbi:sugar ABC transporter substrate-binding protein [Alphaproteobacteria bacterium 46_93_T64]|nr:sugar ABC transporter substrate-binding protein [Alphaproteobacteria bacterium 46_93_T64]